MTFGDTKFAFHSCDLTELKSINSGMSPYELPNNNNINNNNNIFSNLSDKVIDENIINLTNCKYYTVSDFHNSIESNNLNILRNNINGLETKCENLNQFLSNISTQFDIIAVTETSQRKINEEFYTNINLEGYTNFSTPTNTNKGGTIIYTKNTLDVAERLDLNICHNLYKSIWIEINNKNSKNVICGSIYRHPNDNSLSYDNFLIYFESCLSKLSNENKEVYLCGDFNSDLLKLDKVKNYKKFYELMCSYGFLPQILQPTRIQGDSATIIDNIFTNTCGRKIHSGNIITDFSDHYSQFVSVRRVKLDFKKITMYKRNYSNFSEDSFRDDVSIQNFDNNFEDVNDQFKDFYLRLKGCIDRHAPLKKLTPKEVKLNHKPWISVDINKMIKIKNKLFHRKKREPNNLEIKRLYNLFRNRVNRELKKAKRNYYTKYFEVNSNNIKKTWEGIRSIINIKATKQSTISQIKVNSKVIKNQKEIVETLNNFFVNVGPNTDRNIPVNPKIKPEKYLKNRNQLNFLIAHISNEEVLDIINQLENKSTGPQSIPIKLLKLTPDLIPVPLCKIINHSFQTGVFPDAFKLSEVIPIHKGGSTEELNNYRPISLLSIFDKIIEKLMHKRLYDFLQAHNILFQNQFGFRKNNSTTFALIEITEKIKETIDNKKYGCGIFIDLR